MTTTPALARATDALVQYETGGMCRPGRKCQACDCGVENMGREELAEDLRRNLDRARFALSAALTDPDVTQALALHQIESRGMTPSTPDGCTCGSRIEPAPHEDPYEDILVRRGRAFAAHQADAVRAAILGEAP